MKSGSALGAVFSLTLLACVWTAASAEPTRRDLDVIPGPMSQLDGNAGLFVGVEKFDEFPGLDYCMDDAIALAYTFVIELRLIPATNCVLALSGTSSSPAIEHQLQTLRTNGARVVDADMSTLLRQVRWLGGAAKNKDSFVVCAFSSHGFQKDSGAYIVPIGGQREFSRETMLKTSTISDYLGEAEAGKRLIFVDACRRKLSNAPKSKGDDVDFRGAFDAARGHAMLASCEATQVSYEDHQLRHGVFTYYLLDGLRGGAKSAGKFVLLGEIVEHVGRNVETWARNNNQQMQKLCFDGSEQARQIPLAISKAAALAEQQAKLRLQHGLGLLELARKAQPSLLSNALVGEVKDAAEPLEGENLINLVEHLEALAQPTRVNVEGFGGWWNGAGKLMAGLSKPEAIPKTTGSTTKEGKAPKSSSAHSSDGWQFKATEAELIEAARGGDGDVKAMLQLGDTALLGLGGKVDYTQAMLWFERASRKGEPGAYGRMAAVVGRVPGRTSAAGGRTRDEWLSDGIRLEDPDSILLHYGLKRDGPRPEVFSPFTPEERQAMTNAQHRLEEKSKAGDLYSSGRLATCLRYGLGEHNAIRAYGILQAAVERGDVVSMVRQSDFLAFGVAVPKDPTGAVKLLRQAAERGEVHGMCILGRYYADGFGVQRDPAESEKWFLKAKELGSSEALVLLATLLFQRDASQANTWLREAAALGNVKAWEMLGGFYFNSMDFPQAKEWFSKAAATGSGVAMIWMGKSILAATRTGYVSVFDDSKLQAAKWYAQAAIRGHGEAQMHLAEFFLNPPNQWLLDRQAPDQIEALALYSLAVDDPTLPAAMSTYVTSCMRNLRFGSIITPQEADVKWRAKQWSSGVRPYELKLLRPPKQ